jgi:hypothetical protein
MWLSRSPATKMAMGLVYTSDNRAFGTDMTSVNPAGPEHNQFALEYPSPRLCIRSHRRTQGPSIDEWERVRPIITQLYVDQDLKLSDVREIMMEQHDFNATYASVSTLCAVADLNREQMYKKRFDKWSLWKYYRRSQKEAAIAQLGQDIFNAAPAPRPTINGKPLKRARLKRYVRQQQQSLTLPTQPRYSRVDRSVATQSRLMYQSRPNLLTTLDSSPSSWQPWAVTDSIDNSSYTKPQMQSSQLMQSPESHNVELITALACQILLRMVHNPERTPETLYLQRPPSRCLRYHPHCMPYFRPESVASIQNAEHGLCER